MLPVYLHLSEQLEAHPEGRAGKEIHAEEETTLLSPLTSSHVEATWNKGWVLFLPFLGSPSTEFQWALESYFECVGCVESDHIENYIHVVLTTFNDTILGIIQLLKIK